MLLRETGFSFNGIHSRNDMGLIYAEKDGHAVIPKISRNEYRIAGMSGTVLLPGETWDTLTFEGTLYPAEERATQAEAQAMLRNVAAWLTAGRAPLIFDYEPDKFYLAQLSDRTRWSLKNWFGGELGVKFDAQPYAYAVTETYGQKTAASNASQTVHLDLSTGLMAPVRLETENTGEATITRVRMGTSVDLNGLELLTGDKIVIDFEPPMGAVIVRADTTVENALPYAAAFEPVYAVNGSNSVSVRVTHGSGTKRAVHQVYARGRW